MNLVESMKQEGCKEVYSDFFASILDVSKSQDWQFEKYTVYRFVLIEDDEIVDSFISLEDAIAFYMSDKQKEY